MWGAVAAAAISALANSGSLGRTRPCDPDWMEWERKRARDLRRQMVAAQIQGLIGAILMVALIASIVYLILARV